MRPEDLAWTARDGVPRSSLEAIEIQWLGTAGFAIRHAGATLLIDPYITRASLRRCILGPVASTFERAAHLVPEADAIVVGHTHFDHALDVPAIARMRGARVFGSRSAATLCIGQGVSPALVRDVESESNGGRAVTTDVGPFRLTFVPSAHSKFALGRVPFPGEISDCDQLPMRASRYRCGAVFSVLIEVAGRSVYHLGSADLVDANVPPREVDLVLLCVAGWTSTRRFPYRVSRALNPRAVLLSHWDDFFRPITEPAKILPAMAMPRLVDAFHKESRDATLHTLPMLGRMWL